MNEDLHFLSYVNTPVESIAGLKDYDENVTRVHLVNCRLTCVEESLIALSKLGKLPGSTKNGFGLKGGFLYYYIFLSRVAGAERQCYWTQHSGSLYAQQLEGSGSVWQQD
jgi:hypothetical protein